MSTVDDTLTGPLAVHGAQEMYASSHFCPTNPFPPPKGSAFFFSSVGLRIYLHQLHESMVSISVIEVSLWSPPPTISQLIRDMGFNPWESLLLLPRGLNRR